MSVSNDGRQSTLYVLASGNFAQFGSRVLLGSLVPFLLTDLDTTKSAVGLTLTGLWAMYALVQFPSGILADRYGERLLLLSGLAGAAVGVMLVATARSFPVFAAFILLLGAGTGLFYSPASVLLSRLYKEHGRALGILTAVGTLAGLVYPAAGGVAAARFGWRPVLFLTSVVTIAVLIATLWTVPRTMPVETTELGDSIDLDWYRDVLSRPGIRYTLVIAVALLFTFQSLVSFYPTFLVEYHGVDPDIGGIMLGVVLGLSASAQPVAGYLSDRVSRDVALATCITVAMLGLVVLLGVHSYLGTVLGSCMLGAGISWPGPLQARFMDLLDETERGHGFGLVRTIYMLGGATGSVAIGVVTSTSDWFIAYGGLVVLLAGCLGLLAWNHVLSLDL